MSLVKICGLKDEASVEAAVNSGASFIGFVFLERSHCNIDIETARTLAQHIPDTVETVGLFVDATNDEIATVLQRVPLTMLQLHGHESPERVIEVKEKFNIPVMKAIPISEESDLEYAHSYAQVSDWILFDTKTKDGDFGGTGTSFDWSILKKFRTTTPWFLAGGLTPDNVSKAIEITNAPAVDVSSGVEQVRGIKDQEKIKLFLKNASQ